jgi:hypothetical protein
MARRCVVPGCRRWVKAGKAVCREHVKTGAGRAIVAEVRELGRELARLREVGGDDAARIEAVRAFRRRVERGAYEGLLGEPMRAATVEAARNRVFDDGLAALRVTLWQVLGDEGLDGLQMARAVSEVVGMTVRAATARAAAKEAGERADRQQLAALLELLGRDEECLG